MGAVANFADCILYLAEGDYMGAAIAFMNGVTLGATSLATNMLKAGKLCKVANTALKVAVAAERISGGLTFAQNAYNIGQTSIQMYCKYGILGESMGLDTPGDIFSIGLSVMGCADGLHRMGNTGSELLALKEMAANGQLCFVAGTKIKTPNGDKNIEDIEVGDEVYSCDVETGETGSKHVLRTKMNETADIVHVTIDGETIDATPTHPFYVEGYGFKPARELQTGDKVRLLDGTNAEIESVIAEHLNVPVKVYNFEVEDWHTYYVAGVGVLVHNDNKCVGALEGGTGTEIVPYYPPNNGAIKGTEKLIYLEKGQIIDRYGKTSGKYFAPAGTPIEMRALPYGTDLSNYHQYEVIKPFEVESSIIAPAFDNIGLGTQYRSSVSVETLLKHGIIRGVGGGIDVEYYRID